MLDDRAKLLLKVLVERYIADGQPIGSRTLSRSSGLELSPATIRNVMADLEELGLIGVLILLALYILLIMRGLWIAAQAQTQRR